MNIWHIYILNVNIDARTCKFSESFYHNQLNAIKFNYR